MIHKIISGGQTGADQGGLAGAKQVGITTGGTAPKGYRTDEGNNPGLLRDIYGLKESGSWGYPPRTALNVKQSDGTVWFGNVTSPGGKLTKRLCEDNHKPFLENPTAAGLLAWAEANGIRVLNVAGNRERSKPGIHDYVRYLIASAFGD